MTAGHWTRLIRASRAAVYRALLDPLVPNVEIIQRVEFAATSAIRSGELVLT